MYVSAKFVVRGRSGAKVSARKRSSAKPRRTPDVARPAYAREPGSDRRQLERKAQENKRFVRLAPGRFVRKVYLRCPTPLRMARPLVRILEGRPSSKA